MRVYLLFILFVSSFSFLEAQSIYRTEILNKDYASLSITKNGDWESNPIIDIRSSDKINIDFDCLSEFPLHNLKYKVYFCNYDWTLNTFLFESDYVDGINDVRIENYKNSLNTTVFYTHYSIELPNNKIKLKLAGNYVVEVFDEDDEEPILTARFSVLDSTTSINPTISTYTILDANKSNQQVDFEISYSNQSVNPTEEFKVVVTQNNREDNQVIAPSPNFIQASKLIFKNNRDLVFKAGNEYLRFDISNNQVGGIGITDLIYKEPFYHVYVKESMLRTPKTYHYDQTQLGKVIYRLRNQNDVNTEGDYFWVYFSLEADEIHKSDDIYLDGDFTYHDRNSNYKMIFNEETNKFENRLLLKQGIYNYQYLVKTNQDNFVNLQGDFYQTNNLYSIYVYFYDKMDRYYRLVGYKEIRTK